MNLDNIGSRIHELRTSKRMSQLSLGMKIGVTQETISAYENKKAYPTLMNIIQICEIFSVSADYLVGFTNNKNEITGNELSSSEMFWIRKYRDLSVKDKMIVENLINCLIKLNEME